MAAIGKPSIIFVIPYINVGVLPDHVLFRLVSVEIDGFHGFGLVLYPFKQGMLFFQKVTDGPNVSPFGRFELWGNLNSGGHESRPEFCCSPRDL